MAEATINPYAWDLISKQAVEILVDELARAISDERCCISRGRSTATIMQDILDLPPVKLTKTCYKMCDRWKDKPKTDTLDKIRAEIECIAFDWQEIDGEHKSFMVVDLNDVLNIINKYKGRK